MACSFLGVTLGLFDYLADVLGFDDSPGGRLQTAIATFAPPMFCAFIWSEGFLHAIGFAGLAATLWAVITPALLARASRKRFGSPRYRVGRYADDRAGAVVRGICALSHLLFVFGWLPVWR